MEHKQGYSKSSARDVFFYLFMAVLLVWSVVSLSTLLWQYVNYSFPDALQFSYINITGAARTAMAGLIVTWPAFLLISWRIEKDLVEDHSKLEIWVRKWLLYLTLFVCAVVSIVDLVVLLNYFLSGEITIRFVLKALTILAVAVSVFTYYLWELRRTAPKKDNTQMIAALTSSIVVALSIAAGFLIIGTPMNQRAIQMDQQRVWDLQNIQGTIVSNWQMKEVLPTTLDALEDPISGFFVPVDPKTQAAYEYTVKGPLTFELCATFEKKALDKGLQGNNYIYPVNTTDTWDHESGRVCFERTIDPELYPFTK